LCGALRRYQVDRERAAVIGICAMKRAIPWAIAIAAIIELPFNKLGRHLAALIRVPQSLKRHVPKERETAVQ
jgi:hypothetical protein